MQQKLLPRSRSAHSGRERRELGCLTVSDEETQRTGVPVVEPVKVSVFTGNHLVSDSLASRTSEGLNSGLTRSGDGEGTEVLGDTGLSVVGGAVGGGSGQLDEVDVAGSPGGVGSGLEILVSGEEEDERTGLAGPVAWNVEVEDCRGVA